MTGADDAVMLFVYGSLLRGMANHDQMAGAIFVRDAITAAPHTLLDVGDWPGLLRSPRSAVQGELYRVDQPALARLDAFEGVPHLFRRDRVALDADHTAWTYFFEGSEAAPLARTAVVVPHGSWRRWRAPR